MQMVLPGIQQRNWSNTAPILSSPSSVPSPSRTEIEKRSYNKYDRRWSKKQGVSLDTDAAAGGWIDLRSKKKSPPDYNGQKPHRCIAYAVADGFSTSEELAKALRKDYQVISLYRTFEGHDPHTYVKIHGGEGSPSQWQNYKAPAEAFIFQHGAIVFWGTTEEEEKKILDVIKPYQEKTYPMHETEDFDFVYGDSTSFDGFSFILGQAPETHSRYRDQVAFSHALVRAVKLSVAEERVKQAIKRCRDYPDYLTDSTVFKAMFGASKMRKIVVEEMRFVIHLRNFLNLHSELIDTPDFFWSDEQQDLEELFQQVSKHFDVYSRINVINKRIDYLQAQQEMLNENLKERHSIKLEWAIILLIAIEVMFDSIHVAERWRLAEQEQQNAAGSAKLNLE
eukprot:GILJ01007312.1.p1 GENE.GILJ01007312.1~~GILJ01007312.1.p1  ORF type:complete len:449 (+),score=69.46 GILJ01007312.1:166-1347(+)